MAPDRELRSHFGTIRHLTDFEMDNSANHEQKWKLAPGVYYRLAGENVYVRNVSTRYDYLFNPMVKDILDLLKEERTKDELLAELGKTYALKKSPNFGKELDRFLDSLTQKGCLVANRPTITASPKISDAEGHAKGWYQKNHRLWNACFELTYLCNERCRHCYLDDPKANAAIGFLRFDVWKKVIDEIADMGCMNVLVTGGEPTLHPDFLNICRHIVDRGMLLDIFTNALDISDQLFDDIVALHPNTVSFSLYGGTPEFHDWITQVPGSFEKSLKNILMFKCAGIAGYIKSVLFNGQSTEFLKLKRLCRRIGMDLRCGSFVAQGRSKNNQMDLNPDDATLWNWLEGEQDSDPIWQMESVPLRNPNENICGAGVFSISFRPDGAIVPCINYPTVAGDISHDSIQTIWKCSTVFESLRRTVFSDVSSNCANCVDSGFCHVCPGISLTESGHLRPCSYSCHQAHLKHSFFDFNKSHGNVP